MKIETILDQIDLGAMALPEFQRGYVCTIARRSILCDLHDLSITNELGSGNISHRTSAAYGALAHVSAFI